MARVSKLVRERSLLLLPRLGLLDLAGNKYTGFAFTFKLCGYRSEDICLADLLVERLGNVIILDHNDAGGFLAFLVFAGDLQCGLTFLGFLERAFRALQGAFDGTFGGGVLFLFIIGSNQNKAESKCSHSN